jgi:diguanylate cyclase (GGDEF) domain
MKHKILIVEDNLEDFERVQKLVAAENYDISYAPDGASVFPIMEKEIPDLIILDLLLPDVDGFELCKRIRGDERFGHVPLLFYSSAASIDNKLLGLQLGASDFLGKDCDPRELLLRLQNLLRAKVVFDEMVKLSVIDSLTHAYNRRYFQHRLVDEFERGKRYNRDFCCVIVDVDHFKQVNDTFGHPAGDAVLKRVAALLRRHTRSVDVLSRYGGDEFSLLLPETNFQGAYVVAERVRGLIEKTEIGRPEYDIRVTLSIGISSLITGGALGMDELITQADVALYQAKRDGRNKVSFYGRK